MFRRVVTAPLEDIQKTGQVAVEVCVRVFERIPDARLSRQIDDDLEAVFCEQRIQFVPVREVRPDETEALVFLQKFQPCLFQRDIVVVVQVVQADDRIPILQKPAGKVKADKARCARDQDFSHGFSPIDDATRSDKSAAGGRVWQTYNNSLALSTEELPGVKKFLTLNSCMSHSPAGQMHIFDKKCLLSQIFMSSIRSKLFCQETESHLRYPAAGI